MVPSLVLLIVGIMHRVRRAFKAFDDPDRGLPQFVELRIVRRCDQYLVP
jgi:hypothetical protein